MILLLRFDHPALLLLVLLAVPLVALGWRAMRGQDVLRRTVALTLRAALLVAMAIMLAGPRTLREHDQITVIGLLDVSGSIRRFAQLPSGEDVASISNIETLRRWFREATETRADDDRFGLVVFDGRAVAISVPGSGDYVDDGLDVRGAEGTNIAEAIELGLAMFPADTARRLVLITDGNQTLGDALVAARQAAGGAGDPRSGATSRVPIDILPITYRVRRDVRIVSLEAPPTARPGQTVTIRVLMEATEDTPGRLTLRREGRPIDLNGVDPGASRRLVVPAGQSVHLAQVQLQETPVNRFEAIFEPEETVADTLTDNNRAEAFTVTPTKGRTLIVDPRPTENEYLAATLADAGLPVDVRGPAEMPDDLLSLQRYDLVVLDNVAAYDLSVSQQQMLSRHVHDLGGGLIMVGGPTSFGAGGWNGTPVEDVLPLEMDPPQNLLLPQAALVLVLDKSGSMNQRVAGARASQQEVANEAAALAIESLRGQTLVGVITFDMGPRVRVPLQPAEDRAALADQVRSITAEGGTNLAPALQRAYEMLRDVDVDRKRVVCLSDGESPTVGLDALARRMAADNIRLTTIAVGDDADYETLQRLAELGEGEFFPVRDPRKLPRILVDSVQVLNQPLLKDIPFVPVVLPTGSSLTAEMDSAPILDGLVITSPRDDPTVVVEMTHPDGEPLLAHWQAGLGRAAAFTSDARGHWSRRWFGWPGAAAFWTQLARTIARPAVDLQTELRATIEDDRIQVVFEAAAGDGGFLDYLQVEGTVYGPDGHASPLRLRQSAPGRYEGSLPAIETGNYIVALSPRQGDRRLAPAIGGASKVTSAEFRRLESNAGLLEELVELTRGRRLRLDEPAGVDLFDRRGMPTSTSAMPAWRPLVWLALAILLLDIASRRIAWDAARLHALFAKAIARFRPASEPELVAATLSSLRQVSDRFEEQVAIDRHRAGVSLDETAPPAAVGVEPAASEPAKPTSASGTAAPAKTPAKSKDRRQVRAALDALSGRRPSAKEDRSPPTEDRQEKTTEPEEATSSLLAAKRRRERGGG